MSGATDGVSDEASKLLGYIVTAAANANPLIELPNRQFVTAGQAVWDCEEAYVTLVQVITGLPGGVTPGGGVIDNCPLPWTAVFEAAVIRCVPVMDGDTPPTPAALLASAEQQARDTYCLMTAAESRAAERFGGVGCSISYAVPSGGFGGPVARISVTVTT